MTNESWLPLHLKEGETYTALIQQLPLDDASGIGTALVEVANRSVYHRPSGVLLTGPDGCGKHNAAFHIMQSLAQAGYLDVLLSGSALCEGAEGFSDVRERLNALFDHMYDENQGLCLLLEEPESVPWHADLYLFLGKTVQEYAMNADTFPPVFLILLSNRSPSLGPLLRSRLLRCECTPPNRAQRERFLSTHGAPIHKMIDLNRLAELTDGCSYAELEELVNYLSFQIDRLDRALQPDELESLSVPFLPESERNSLPIVRAISRLESALGNLRAAGAPPAAVQAPAQEPAAEFSDLDVERKRVEALTPKNLVFELLGEARTQHILDVIAENQ